MAFKEAELTQIKYYRDSDSNVARIFVSYEITDDAVSDKKYIEHWLSGEDIQAFLRAGDKEQALIDLVAPIIRDAHETWVNTVTPPPVEALDKAAIQAQFSRKIVNLPARAQAQVKK